MPPPSSSFSPDRSRLDPSTQTTVHRLVHLAADLFDASMAHLLAVEDGRVQVQTRVGTAPPADAPLSAFDEAVLEAEAPLLVEDAAADPRWAQHPWVAEHGVRFYAGGPVWTDDGRLCATLVVMDRSPRSSPEAMQGPFRRLRTAIAHVLKRSRIDPDREDAQDPLREVNRRLQLALDAANAGTFSFDVAAGVVHWDARTCRLYGLDPEPKTVDETRIDGIVHPEDREHLHRRFYEAIEADERYEVEYRIVQPNGEERVIRSHGIVVRDETGTAQRVIGINQDVTERVETARTLRMMSAAVEHSREAILVTEADPIDEPGPRIVYVNSAFESMTGYAADEVLGATPRILQGPATDRAVLRELRDALERETAWTGEAINYRRDGTPFVLQWSIAPVRGTDGDVEYWVSVQRDVTERRRVERYILALTDQERSRIGRELHNRVASEMTGTAFLARSLADQMADVDPEAASTSAEVAQLVNETTEAVRRLSQSLMPMEVPENDLAAGLRELVVRRCRPSGPRCTVEIEGADVDAHLQALDVDVATQLYRIADEGLTIALEHSHATTIDVRLRVHDDVLCLRVCDDGAIPEDTASVRALYVRLMQYRAQVIGATLTVDTLEETGTVVQCRLAQQKGHPPISPRTDWDFLLQEGENGSHSL